MKQFLFCALALCTAGMTIWSCATPVDTDFFGSGGGLGEGGSESSGGGSNPSGGVGPGSTSSGGSDTSSSSASSSAASSSAASSSSSSASSSSSSGGGSGCNQMTCLTQCFQSFKCGVCMNGQCACTDDFSQCFGGGFDGGFPDFDGGLPDFDGGFPGFDGGLPDGFSFP